MIRISSVMLAVLLLGGAHTQSTASPPVPAQTSPDVSSATKPHAFDKPPVLIFSPDPEFTKQERKKKISGVVDVRIHVTEQGDVDDAAVTRGLRPDLDAKALEVTRKYRFKPAMKDDRAVSCVITVEVHFEIY